MAKQEDEVIMRLPCSRRARVVELTARGDGLMMGAGFGGGMINSFWHDCVRGEIIRYLRRKGKDKTENYVNRMRDFYIDSRCGRAPRGRLRELANELILAICDDYHPCECPKRVRLPATSFCETQYVRRACSEPTQQTAQQQHDESESHRKKNDEFRNPWQLSARKLGKTGLTPASFVCYSCYQDRLATSPHLCGVPDTTGADKDWLIKNTCNKGKGHTGKHWCRRNKQQFYW